MIKKFFKKIKNLMYDNFEALAQTRDYIKGKEYQWVNTPDDNKVATRVTVTEVFQRGGLMAVSLSDGSTITLDELNSKLMPLMENQEPLSKAEALSIRGPQPGQKVKKEVTEAPIATQPEKNVDSAQGVTNIFSMFATEESLLNLNLRVNLPSLNLLKMMYKSSQNKTEFLSQLASHINNQINADHIKDALLKKLDSK
jgi:hypothetical protein